MASLIAQVCLKSLKKVEKICYPSTFYALKRYSSVPPRKKQKRGTIKHRNLISSTCESLAARGFLRSWKPYTPPSDVSQTVSVICENILGRSFESTDILSRENKFAILKACFEELNHTVPNSSLHKINNVDDVIQFYETPVSTTVPYDEFKNQDLPPNLHIQEDYLRFHPETDTKFKGISAFPRSSTVVTGLKYKKKYKGYKAPLPLYYDNEPLFRSGSN